jgi:1,4-alpha-glucan branching enzyme
MRMNTYDVDGIKVDAINDYDAVKKVYRTADKIELCGTYEGRNSDDWLYRVIFRNGHAMVGVLRV